MSCTGERARAGATPRWIADGYRAGLLCLALSISPVVAAPEAPAAPGPVIELRETAQDGGTVEQGTVVKYRFPMANRGQADLELQRVETSCGCTVPRWDKVIAPGKEGAVEAWLDTTIFRGPLAKTLTVYTNDPAHRQIKLILNATVTPLVLVTPGETALFALEDEAVTQEFTLERPSGGPMKVLEVAASQPFLKTKLTPLSGGSRYQLSITATPEMPMGRTVVPVVVKTDLPRAGTRMLTLILERGIVAIPARIFWPWTGGEVKPPVRTSILIRRQKRPFRVTGATVDDPKLSAEVLTLREGEEYRVILTYSGGWEGGAIRRTLTVTTDDPKQAEIRVSVEALLPQKPAAARGAP
jgi:hypothetical protein